MILVCIPFVTFFFSPLHKIYESMYLNFLSGFYIDLLKLLPGVNHTNEVVLAAEAVTTCGLRCARSEAPVKPH